VGTFEAVIEWFGDPANWQGTFGIPNRLLEHLYISVSSLLAAMIPAIPLGIYIGHKRRFEFVTVSIANLGRALPSFAILALAFPIALELGLGFEFWPAFVALFFLAIPPMLTNTYVGVREVDQDAIDAARGMGMSEGQILKSVKLPLAIPLIVAGIRTSTLQVIATATLAAVTGYGGLGRYIVDGFARGEFARDQVLAGAILVALLALVVELVLGVLERWARRRAGLSPRREVLPAYQEVLQMPRTVDATIP
jgi:osmoprotectant transport system permease protein